MYTKKSTVWSSTHGVCFYPFCNASWVNRVKTHHRLTFIILLWDVEGLISRQEKYWGWLVSMTSLCSRPGVTPCDEVVKINPPFHPAWLVACVKAALMERIHPHTLLIQRRLDWERNLRQLCVLFVFEHRTLHVCTGVVHVFISESVTSEQHDQRVNDIVTRRRATVAA